MMSHNPFPPHLTVCNLVPLALLLLHPPIFTLCDPAPLFYRFIRRTHSIHHPVSGPSRCGSSTLPDSVPGLVGPFPRSVFPSFMAFLSFLLF
ncbi:hypothetical protein DFJ73DRAFT_860911 [Zopfochytrium polystomum]|nr:hypothetical protein DFJ73DRAFT_860911 [Zopfochytrium polystomum]